MDVNRLNFKHLRYFWMVAKTGSIARASERLHLTPQSISGQLSEFESMLGVELFRRAGRGIEITDEGRQILSIADEIFALGDELLDTLRRGPQRKIAPFRIGIADSVPKQVAYRLVEPALQSDETIRLICREGRLSSLLGELAVHHLDLVIADRPMPTTLNVRGYSHLLGESEISLFGTRALLDRYPDPFPQVLQNAPLLLPGEDVSFAAKMTQWLDENKIYPMIIGEFDDSALINAFGQAGRGFFAAPTAIAENIIKNHGVVQIGQIPGVKDEFYAITTERRLVHPAIVAIRDSAQGNIFKTGKK